MICILVISAGIVTAQDDIELVPIPLDPSIVDINGVWNYTVTPTGSSGVCPPDPGASGQLSITVVGSVITLEFLSGRVCSPPSMCIFEGEVVDGKQILVSNIDIVDNEGGEATNAITLFFSSDKNGWGSGGSRYIHPDGYECVWDSNITISR